MTAPPSAARYKCPKCKAHVEVRIAPSGQMRLTRHDQPTEKRVKEPASCPGTGTSIAP